MFGVVRWSFEAGSGEFVVFLIGFSFRSRLVVGVVVFDVGSVDRRGRVRR